MYKMFLSVSCWKVYQSVQLLSCVQLFVTPWIVAHQASLSIANSQSSLKLMSLEFMIPSSHLILCFPICNSCCASEQKLL